eukprot:4796017-Pleurochrysis_carterae.AAC.1
MRHAQPAWHTSVSDAYDAVRCRCIDFANLRHGKQHRGVATALLPLDGANPSEVGGEGQLNRDVDSLTAQLQSELLLLQQLHDEVQHDRHKLTSLATSRVDLESDAVRRIVQGEVLSSHAAQVARLHIQTGHGLAHGHDAMRPEVDK